jgi:UDP-N-acetyl-D-mannosaminuronic acid dehydrogenase
MKKIEYLFCNKKDTILDALKVFNNAPTLFLPSGIVIVVNEFGEVAGTVTEGDVRRGLLSGLSLDSSLSEVMNAAPIIFDTTLSLKEIAERIPEELEKRNRKSRIFLGKILIVDNEKKPVKVLEYHELWEQKVATHRHLVVVGLGYVGLTLAVVMADAGFQVTGVEVSQDRCEMLKNGNSYIHEIGLQELLREQIHKNFKVANTLPEDGDVYIISVGTPVEVSSNGKKQPIMRFLDEACTSIGSKLKRGNLVILRSTVPIGTCRNFVKAKLEEASCLVCGVDFNLAFAPERTAEGKALKELRSLPQIIGGYNSDSLEATAAIFRDLTPTIVKVDSLEAAEMAKLINNSFRDYIFAYSNQIAKIAANFNIDVFGVIKAANEGYVRDPVPLPSPGVGGPCLTKDPYIFASVAETKSFDSTIFIHGRRINESMHDYVFDRVNGQLTQLGKDLSKIRILLAGLAFKGNPETGDIRNSSAVEIGLKFLQNGAIVTAYDPVAEIEEMKEYGFTPVPLNNAFMGVDAVLFLNNHKSFEKIDMFKVVREMNDKPIIFDGWNAFRAEDIVAARASVYMNLSLIKSSLL